MIKTSTLIYSIHNLASASQSNFISANDLGGKDEFSEVHRILDESQLFDVCQSVVDNILLIAESLK